MGLLLATTSARATDYYETPTSDLSNNSANPTSMGSLTLGSNRIVGSTVPSGPIVDPMTGARAIEDDDYVSFTVPTGTVLSQLILGGDSVFQPGDRMFIGISQGVGVSVDPSFTSAKGLLGWTLLGSAASGTDVLPALGLSAPAMFPAIGGATRFSGALGAGTYTLWMVDGDQPASYSLNLLVSAVPEAGTWATMLTGLVLAGACLRRRPARVRAAAATA